MEESKDTVLYEDYKFLTANDLQQLNATHLIGTPMLKAYMHGYFIEMRAYQKLLSVADPFAYERFRKEQISQKLNSMREKRIQVNDTSKLPKVNKDLIKDLMETAKTKKKGVSGEQVAEKLMKDDRFGKMFTDKEFQIDRNSEAYKLVKPQDAKGKRIKDDDVDSVGAGSEDEEDVPMQKARDINKLFAGKGDEDEEERDGDSDNDDDF